MLSKEENTLITHVDVDMPLGRFFRRYWIPAMHAEELPENECPPVRIKL